MVPLTLQRWGLRAIGDDNHSFVLLYDDNGFSQGRVHHHSVGGLDVCLPKGVLRWDFNDDVDDYDDLTSQLEKKV